MKKHNISARQILSFILILLIFSGGLDACKKKDSNLKENPPDPEITLGETDLSISAAASEQSVEITSNVDWIANTDAKWITITTKEGEKGSNKIQFNIAENKGDERKGIITISPSTASGSGDTKITITQEASNTYIDKRANIYVKEGATGSGSSWDNPSDLDSALKSSVEGSVIHIAAGTYTPSLTITGGADTDPGDVTFEINKNVTLLGGYPADVSDTTTPADPSSNKTILSGLIAVGNAYHVVAISAPVSDGGMVKLDGLTITDGYAAEPSGTDFKLNGVTFLRNDGGGIFIGNAHVEINNCEITKNHSHGSSAGIFIVGENADVKIRNSIISKNEAEKGNGAGIWVYTSAKASIYNSEIIGNVGKGGNYGVGPGIYGYPNATIFMYNTTVANNVGTSYGAAVYVRESRIQMVNCLIYGNTSSSGFGGGGLLEYGGSDAVVVSSTIVDNSIAGPGGGIFRKSGQNTLTIYNSIISGNDQASGSSDMDDDGKQPAPVVRSTVVGAAVYNSSGIIDGSLTFDPKTMLDQNSYLPVGDNDPAISNGMSASALSSVGSSLTPPLEANFVTIDLNGNDRSGNMMGCLVK